MKKKSWLAKSIKIAAALSVAAAAFAYVDTAKAVSFNYSSSDGANIVFPGNGTFTFAPGVNNFSVTSGSAIGLFGEMTGTFNIGAITTIGITSSAPVTGTGTFVIHDGANNLTATLQWLNISQTGSGGTLNVTGQVNLTNIMYTGSNADLVALRDAGSGSNVLTFQFVPPVSLEELRNGPGSRSTSFSGSINTVTQGVPDGGVTVALLGLSLAGIAALRLKMAR